MWLIYKLFLIKKFSFYLIIVIIDCLTKMVNYKSLKIIINAFILAKVTFIIIITYIGLLIKLLLSKTYYLF